MIYDQVIVKTALHDTPTLKMAANLSYLTQILNFKTNLNYIYNLNNFLSVPTMVDTLR